MAFIGDGGRQWQVFDGGRQTHTVELAWGLGFRFYIASPGRAP